MRKFMFVIDGSGLALCVPMEGSDDEIRKEWGVSKGNPVLYQLRARFNWDRGCYYMEADITDEQEEVLKNLVVKQEDWIGAQQYVEGITGRNFETETGYENPFDPDWEPDFGPEWEAARELWLKRAGICIVGSV